MLSNHGYNESEYVKNISIFSESMCPCVNILRVLVQM